MEIVNFLDKCIIVKIPIGTEKRRNLYEATRRCWRANLDKAKKAEYVLGTIDGDILCVIKISKCNYVENVFCINEKEKCKRDFGVNIVLCEKIKRIEFEGKEEINDKKYLWKKLPEKYIPKQMPIRYTY
jgi:hypothetical protein